VGAATLNPCAFFLTKAGRNTETSDFTRAKLERTGITDEGNQRVEQSHEKLRQSSHGQRRDKPNDDGSRTIENQEHESRRSGKGDFDFDQARRHAEKLRQSTSEVYGSWKERDGSEQSKDSSKNERNRGSAKQQHEAMIENMNGLENRAMTMVQNVRKGVLINYWLDVAKYGLGTALFVVPLYIGVKLLLDLFGIEMP
jgi:hypothetical protein